MIIFTCQLCQVEFTEDDMTHGDCPYCGCDDILYHDTDKVDTLDDERQITLKDYEGD